jgi:flagellar assembly factor FliW
LDRFLLIRPAEAGPWIVLQSLQSEDTAFLSLPVRLLEPAYEWRISEEDRAALGWDRTPGGLLALALVAVTPEGRALANLLGPVLADPATRRALQAVRDDRKYGAAEDVESRLARQEGAKCW